MRHLTSHYKSHILQISVMVFLAMALVWAGSCGPSPDDAVKIQLASSHEILPADGEVKAALIVRVYDRHGTLLSGLGEQAALLLDGKGFEGRTFQTKTEGEYKFVAEYNGLRSNEVVINAYSAKAYVYGMLKSIYFWAKHVPDIDIAKYTSPEALLTDLRYGKDRGGPDRWSYIANRAAESAYYNEGKHLGFGFRMEYDAQGDLRIISITEPSSASKGGLKRGMKILRLNQLTPEEIWEKNLWSEILKDEPGTPLDLEVEDVKGQKQQISITKDWLNLKSVEKTNSYLVEDRRVGYLLFSRFIRTSFDELDVAFSEFQNQKISDIVVDLRYNGGGLTSVVRTLASLITGEQTHQETCFQFQHNDKYTHWDAKSLFAKQTYSLNLKRAFMIVGRDSASASELLINCLRPYIRVILVGEKTYGKPVGMYSFPFFDKVLVPISYQIVNSKNEGDYFQGMPPDIESPDDLAHELGDSEESRLKDALSAIRSGKYRSTRQQPLSVTTTRRIPRTFQQQLIGTF
jgi:C-terminal peptidase prc